MDRFRLLFIKTGNIGASTLIEHIIDERATRQDIEVRVVGCGSRLDPASVVWPTDIALNARANLVVYVTPNASLPGPMEVIKAIRSADIPLIVVSDGPAVKAREAFEELGAGYILLHVDPMIGARSDLLDPTEMVLFNADVLKVLAACGVVRTLARELDAAIEGLKGGDATLPRTVIDHHLPTTLDEFSNPYARAKAIAALDMASRVGRLDVEGCFMEKEPTRYLPLIAGAHELMRGAALLADEVRELEKADDALLRTPHRRDGVVARKRPLDERPVSP